MINIEHVSKQFGSLQVLEDISINIDQGDIFGIIGQSGAGKSTLLRCINGLEKYNGGSITVEGKEIAGLSQKELQLVRKDMGMIFQNFNLLGRLNVYDNIALPLQFWGQNKNSKENHDRIMELLDLVGLKDKVNHRHMLFLCCIRCIGFQLMHIFSTALYRNTFVFYHCNQIATMSANVKFLFHFNCYSFILI